MTDLEKDLEKSIKILTKKVDIQTKKLKDVVLSASVKPLKTKSYWDKVRRDIQKIYVDIQVEFSKWSETYIPISYKKSIEEVNKKIIANKKISKTANNTISKMLKTQGANQMMIALYQDAISSMSLSLMSGLKEVERWTRKTQQALLAESQIDLEVAKGIEKGNLTLTSRNLRDEFINKSLLKFKDGKFVKAGRNSYTPKYYAELVARTKFHEAHSMATVAMAKNYDTDLVIVSSHNTTTKICMPYEGKIFSLSGKDKRFPVLDAYPPFHPNCLHLLYPQFETALEANGDLEKFSEFSKGKINKPPLPKNFIPIKDRN